MNPGKLRHRITIQEYIKTRNEYNEIIEDWRDFAKVWASVEPISGKEYWAKHQVQAEITHRIRIRYREGIKPTMRVLFNKNRVFEIESVINWQEKNIDLQLMCKEVIR